MDNLDLDQEPGADWDLAHPGDDLYGQDGDHLDHVGLATDADHGWDPQHGDRSPGVAGHHDPELDGVPQEIGYSMTPVVRLVSHLITEAHDLSAHSMPSDPDHFDPSEVHHDVDGNPGEHMELWHMQENPDTCAVVAQEYILEHVLGHPFQESDLVHEAEQAGIYHPGGGTTREDMGRLLELHGVQVERSTGASVEDISQALDAGHHVIACVDASELTHQGLVSSLLEVVGLPGRPAGHAVEVIGVNRDDPDHPTVVLNDPGRPDGCGLEVPVEVFNRAADPYDHFLVTTTNKAPVGLG